MFDTPLRRLGKPQTDALASPCLALSHDFLLLQEQGCTSFWRPLKELLFLLSAKQVCMGSGTGQNESIILGMPDEQPIRFTMALPGTSPLTRQPVGSMTRFETPSS